MESDSRLPTGEWTGFFLDKRMPNRGWMHLYLEFAEGVIKGEGTDFVGPWIAKGSYELVQSQCLWVKQYVGKHTVQYSGKVDENGIVGSWRIEYLTGEFHIWPQSKQHLSQMYLEDELEFPNPTIQLGTAPKDDWA